MKLLLNEISTAVKELKQFPFKNLNENQLLFIPIESAGLTEDLTDQVILTEIQDVHCGFSYSSKPGLLLDHKKNKVYLAYVIVDNQQSLNLNAYSKLLSAVQKVDFSNIKLLLEKEAMIVKRETVVGYFEVQDSYLGGE